MPRLTRITPMVPSADIAASIAFFRDMLGFEVGVEMESYAFLKRDGVAARLIAPTPQKDMNDPNSQMHCYIDVDDVDALYAELAPALRQLPDAGRRLPTTCPMACASSM